MFFWDETDMRGRFTALVSSIISFCAQLIWSDVKKKKNLIQFKLIMDTFGLFLLELEMLLNYKMYQHVKDAVVAVSSSSSLQKK